MTKDDFAVKYANNILNARDKENEITKVIQEINTLTYQGNDEPLTSSDKRYIIDKTYNLLLDGRHQRDSKGRIIILNEKENVGYLEMLKAISAKLGEVKGK